MSSHIEYRHVAVAYSTAHMETRWKAATGEEKCAPSDTVYVVFVESGDSNCTVIKRINGRQQEVFGRGWSIAAIGMHYQVIKHACRIAPFAHSGMTKLRNRGPSGEVTPEAYIRCYRNVLAKAMVDDGRLPILGNKVIRMTDPMNERQRCPWLTQAKHDGRLTEEPRRYSSKSDTQGVLRLSESNTDGSLACDLQALASVFEYHGEDYPHFKFESAGVEVFAEHAWQQTQDRLRVA